MEGENIIMKRIAKYLAKLCLLFLTAAFCLMATAGIVLGFKGYTMYRSAVRQEPIEEKLRQVQNSEEFVPFEELPQIYVDAVTAAEDKRFWNHHGIDLLAMARAAFHDLQAMSFVEGGSTITQQLMKNQYFNQDKNIERKIGEIFGALKLEQECSKREIFEWYVNTIYFGSGYYGIGEAARGYFGKEPSQLEDWEALLLAGLPNAPSAYSPDASPRLALQRARQVADCMIKCEMITDKQAETMMKCLGNFVTEKKLETG